MAWARLGPTPVVEDIRFELGSTASVDTVHTNGVVVARSLSVAGPLRPGVVGDRDIQQPLPGSGCRAETYEPAGVRKPTDRRFQPLMATMAMVSATCSDGLNSRAVAS